MDEVAAGTGIGYFKIVWDKSPSLGNSIWGGASVLPETIAARLGDKVRTGARVTSVDVHDDRVPGRADPRRGGLDQEHGSTAGRAGAGLHAAGALEHLDALDHRDGDAVEIDEDGAAAADAIGRDAAPVDEHERVVGPEETQVDRRRAAHGSRGASLVDAEVGGLGHVAHDIGEVIHARQRDLLAGDQAQRGRPLHLGLLDEGARDLEFVELGRAGRVGRLPLGGDGQQRGQGERNDGAKRLVAYSSISQMGVLATVLVTEIGTAAAILAVIHLPLWPDQSTYQFSYLLTQPQYSPDGKSIVSSGGDKFVKLWSTEGTQIKSFEGHTDVIRTVSFSPDGRLLASGGGDNVLKIWDVSSGKLIIDLKGHTMEILQVAFSPDGSLVASASSDGTVKIWDLRPILNKR